MASGQHDAHHPAGISTGPGDTQQAVRFASVNQEIEPVHNLQPYDTTESSERPNTQVLSPETQAELERLSTTLQNVRLQQRRLSNFAFEPVSLPVSRVPSIDPNSQQASRENSISAESSSFRKPSATLAMNSPPLTPAATRSLDRKRDSTISGAALTKVHPEVSMTPQISPPRLTPPPPSTIVKPVDDGYYTNSTAISRPPSSPGQVSTRPTSTSGDSGIVHTHPRHTQKSRVGSSGNSLPASREHSPSRTPGGGSGTVTPPSYSRPFTPLGESDDPYARSKRPPQPKNLDQIESRFVFGSTDGRRRSGIGSAVSLPQLPRSRSGGDLKGQENKHQSTFSLHSLGGKKDHFGHLHEDSSSGHGGKSHGSMSDLKRFFRIGNKSKRAQSPSASSKASANKSGARTPPHHVAAAHVPFGEDHGLQTKYGKFGKILGSGAGGSVRLMRRSSDGVTFAVKQFRDRHSYETEKEYAKKVTAEFCIGSTLHHGNIIETLDIVYERGHWYEVMEYAPYDLFAIVMTGKMSRQEIACSFLQILSGVTYLHSMGLAHRDLKLDNVVVNEHGIMKLIDFGSACIFRYPFENDVVRASGVVGSDPYLAPEVYDNAKYDPQPVDIWSLAIIFACMSLRRFPWKAPRLTDNSYKLFVSAPTPGAPTSEPGPRRSSDGRPDPATDPSSAAEDSRRRSAPHSEVDGPSQKQEVIKGPWRLLRLLPRESRNIIGAMLEIDPKRRATMDDLMQDPWITQTPVCRQEERGVIVSATNHEHTLEAGTAVSPAPILPLANSPGGHRLGVNGLAVDSKRSVLYSGGRDGVICAWNLDLGWSQPSSAASNPFASPEDPAPSLGLKTQPSTSLRRQVQAHTHWVNDVVLVERESALVSASSDITVKVWRPQAEDGLDPQTIGLHNDYVKCVATPGSNSDWVASGGLDQRICLWDLNGGGEKLRINVGEEESSVKGSVYALSVRGSILASGGPESIVRVWDPKSGKRITKLVGHTDNIRDVLINQDGDMIMTASSDQTVKVWSMAAGRCMHTLTMHNDSVWSLFSNHPQLSVFYSGDRSGLVAKTDVRGCADMDEGRCVAICQEHEGVNKVVCAGDYIWTATSSSSINRWKDVDTEAEVQATDAPRHHGSSSISGSKMSPPLPPPAPQPRSSITNGTGEKRLPLSSLSRLSNTAKFPAAKTRDVEATMLHSGSSMRKPSEAMLDTDMDGVVPFHELPEETIEGQSGLIKHLLLNDRKRVLTLDTAGEVMMWDLLECVPIKSYGKRHLEDVAPEVNTTESVANWCAVDTRTGRLACVLEENHCFDAETYADELEPEESLHFREDQRINLGRWVLRYLFADLIHEETKRDEAYRKNLTSHALHPTGLQRGNAPPSIQLPTSNPADWNDISNIHDPAATPRATNGHHYPAMTPGLSIGVATPYLPPSSQGSHANSHLPSTSEEGADLEKRMSHQSQPRSSSERSGDYFSTRPAPNSASQTDGKVGESVDGAHVDGLQFPTDPPTDKEEKTKESSSLFGKKFRMNFPKKLGRSSMDAKPAVVDEKSEVSSDKSSEKEDKVVGDNFFGVVQKIRYEYDEWLQKNPGQALSSGVNPSASNETPVLRPPRSTTVIIQEDGPDSGGVADVFRGTVGSLGREADQIEKVAPMWLGELLLRNQIPVKEVVKVSFVLQPYQDLLPTIASADGNSRLNANRMLRARKILIYVAERIEPQPEHQDPNALKPEEYLELYCQNQLVPPTMTLATIRTHIWKTGGDVLLYYKANGRKRILGDRSAILDSRGAGPQSHAEAAPSEFR